MQNPTTHSLAAKATGEDTRIVRTRAALCDAMIALILEQGNAHVSIRTLTNRANVSYATYFRHFKSIDALLVYMQQCVLEDLNEAVADIPLGEDPVGVATMIFKQAQKSPEHYTAVLRVMSHTDLRQKVLAFGKAMITKDWQAKPNASVPVDIALFHLVLSITEMLQWWLEHQQPYTPEQMGETLGRLVFEPVITQALMPKPVAAPRLTP